MTPLTAMSRRVKANRLIWQIGFAVGLAVVFMANAAHAESLVRVLSEKADVRTGPSVAHRVIYVAGRGEVLEAVDRFSSGYWFRVVLPTGVYGWVLGDQVTPVEVEMSADGTAVAPGAKGWWGRLGDAIFAPGPLLDADVGLTFSVGVLGGDGMFLFRPSWVLTPHVSLEGHIGQTLGNQIDVLYYGAGANVFLWPDKAITPFFGLGGGAATARKKADEFVVAEGTFTSANVGGGLLFAFRKRITLRFDARSHVLFDANRMRSAEELSGGLVILF